MDPHTIVIMSSLVGLSSMGLWESVQLSRARRAVPVRIHVNGTRGKSTVTRLIWAGLRASGRTVVGKTTGSAARVLLPDGREEDVPRRGRPNIREQIWVMGAARRHRADALVVECMALRPDLQWITEHRILHSTIGVITNVRSDHSEVMGGSQAMVATSLANTVPRAGTLVLGASVEHEVFRARARALGTEVVVSSAEPITQVSARCQSRWLEENIAIALAVTRLCGVPDARALEAMITTPADPGAARVFSFKDGDAERSCVDATAANDPESLQMVLEELVAPGGAPGSVVVVFNHRSDRPGRLLQMLPVCSKAAGPEALLITGERPTLSQWHAMQRNGWQATYVRPALVRDAVSARADEGAVVVACGNRRGFDAGAVFGG